MYLPRYEPFPLAIIAGAAYTKFKQVEYSKASDHIVASVTLGFGTQYSSTVRFTFLSLQSTVHNLQRTFTGRIVLYMVLYGCTFFGTTTVTLLSS